jgi:channel protein (hemolysin III family)
MRLLAIHDITAIPGFQEPFSAMSHLGGAGVYLVLSWWLIRKARGNRWRVAAVTLFAFAVVFQMAMSGTYHLLGPHAGRAVLQRLDHAAIFTLIAASFTVVHGILFRHFMRWGMIGLMWTLTATAITLKTIWFDAVPEWLSTGMYLVLGWLGVLSGVALWRRFGFRYMQPILWGGLAYTIGAVCEFGRWPTLVGGVVGPHELFHVAVLAGVGCHWYFAYGIADGRVDPLEVEGRLE